MGKNSIEITGNSEFAKEVLNYNGPVLVDFHASWCGPCKAMAPTIEKIADKRVGKLKVVKVEVDNDGNADLVDEFRIASVPSLFIFNNGKKIAGEPGAKPEEVLEKWIDQHIS